MAVEVSFELADGDLPSDPRAAWIARGLVYGGAAALCGLVGLALGWEIGLGTSVLAAWTLWHMRFAVSSRVPEVARGVWRVSAGADGLAVIDPTGGRTWPWATITSARRTDAGWAFGVDGGVLVVPARALADGAFDAAVRERLGDSAGRA